MFNKPVYCPYCNREAERISNEFLYGKVYGNGMAWDCRHCDAFTGCSDDGRPIGALANKELRMARKKARAHVESFVTGQVDEKSVRNMVYASLTRYLGISRQVCAIGRFNLDMCQRTMDFDPDRFNI